MDLCNISRVLRSAFIMVIGNYNKYTFCIPICTNSKRKKKIHYSISLCRILHMTNRRENYVNAFVISHKCPSRNFAFALHCKGFASEQQSFIKSIEIYFVSPCPFRGSLKYSAINVLFFLSFLMKL